MLEDLKKELLKTPGIARWSEMVELIEGLEAAATPLCWEYPLLTCEAVGGDCRQAVPGAAAVFCLLTSIRLVDDLLDEDPAGLHHELGEARTANLALAFQAAANSVLVRDGVAPRLRGQLMDCLGRIGLDTAFGQELDAGSPSTEADYWHLVKHKTPPLFGGAFRIGAILGGASEELSSSLEEIGRSLGVMIQVSDDLKDAMESPARPDWKRRYNNLPILYALTAEHPEKEEFLALVEGVDEPETLVEAQRILLRCGAVSFCVYHFVEIHNSIKRRIKTLELRSPRPLERLLEAYARPTRDLFEALGVDCSGGIP